MTCFLMNIPLMLSKTLHTLRHPLWCLTLNGLQSYCLSRDILEFYVRGAIIQWCCMKEHCYKVRNVKKSCPCMFRWCRSVWNWVQRRRCTWPETCLTPLTPRESSHTLWRNWVRNDSVTDMWNINTPTGRITICSPKLHLLI